MRPTATIGRLIRRLGNIRGRLPFDSQAYWERLYSSGGNSGSGSYGVIAAFKAEVINTLVQEQGIGTVVELGCGDGNQLTYMHYPRYLGVNVSPTVIDQCRRMYGDDPSKQFLVARPDGDYGTFDLALSLEVLFHLVDDEVFETYMQTLCRSASRLLVIFASNGDPLGGTAPWGSHIRHRRFTDWMERKEPRWKLTDVIPNRFPYRRDGGIESGCFADFYIYRSQRMTLDQGPPARSGSIALVPMGAESAPAPRGGHA